MKTRVVYDNKNLTSPQTPLLEEITVDPETDHEIAGHVGNVKNPEEKQDKRQPSNQKRRSAGFRLGGMKQQQRN